MLRKIENNKSTGAIIQKATDTKGQTLAYSVVFQDGTVKGNIPRLGLAREIAATQTQTQEAA